MKVYKLISAGAVAPTEYFGKIGPAHEAFEARSKDITDRAHTLILYTIKPINKATVLAIMRGVDFATREEVIAYYTPRKD